ncbi:MAG TPA: dihydrolipoamide acetyltransferase family protein [Anaeromyxobacteraceae bacterium]|nr:dihydrolipoamide acetyltransferase family protein [Anaeromyxobacteraceae bacterium]
MAIELQMPKIGLTMTEGKVVEWRKQVGQRVEKGEVVFVFETEKTTFDVESPGAGFLARIVVEEDETVPVGAVVGLLAEREGEKIEWTGRADAPAAPPAAAASGVPAPAGGRLVVPSGMRRVIAERMSASRREAAQAEMTVSIDATRLLEAREALGAGVEREAGAPLTVTDLVLAVTAAAVSSHPDLNSRWTPEGILYLDAIHMGVALSVPDGLVVPVIRDIGRKTLAQVAGARARLVERGRAGELTPDEIKGSTITVSSLGMFGVEQFTAILNPPESAILAVGAIRDVPVAVDRQVVVRPVMKVTLSYDHRVVDGAAAARFLKTFRELAESPSSVVA